MKRLFLFLTIFILIPFFANAGMMVGSGAVAGCTSVTTNVWQTFEFADPADTGAWANENDNPIVTWDGAWTKRTDQTDHLHSTGDRIVSSADVYAAHGTATTNVGSGIAVIATFKAAAL